MPQQVQGIRGLGSTSLLKESRTWDDVQGEVAAEMFGGSSGPVRRLDMDQLIQLKSTSSNPLPSDAAYDPNAIPENLKGILSDAAMVHLLSVWDPEGNLRVGFDVDVVRQVAAPLANVREMFYDFLSLCRVPVKQYVRRGSVDLDLLREKSPEVATYLADWAGRWVYQPEVNDYVEFTGRVLRRMPSTPSNDGSGVGSDFSITRVDGGFGKPHPSTTGSAEYRAQQVPTVWKPLGLILRPLRTG